ncbi:family 20 glycosylhydrolase [Maribellus comscasis]|uniref:beta-N-acetylhexosaminidase n=1 Tax=Maribellus comscasis TaxID=2681766 RepID=A0A6I6K152_9BACT|nr:family 20 glycosylhydrolase [Maribellus comscasis]QGY46152.1 family 20 glycosylhydrolase [Maribellus comscasis]
MILLQKKIKYISQRLICLVIFYLFAYPGYSKEKSIPPPFKIIPCPQELVILQGKGLHFGELSSIKLSEGLQRPVMGTILNQLPERSINRKGILSLKISKGENIPASEEGYVLYIENGNAEIMSKSEAGLFYGCQTLEQLLEDARDCKKAIPACRITDYPEMSYRAVQFDVKHHLDHMDYYYKSIDRLARYKINAVVFEFEDKLRYRRQPIIAAPQAMSIDEMAALTKYAKDRNIEITPLVQGLGHATFILKHQQYAHLREQPENRWAFCPLNEGTYQVLFDMYLDAIEATPGAKYFHIGGDEVGNIGICPQCGPKAQKEGLLSLNLYWLNRVCDFLIENGRIPVFWDDMPLKEAGVYHSTDNANMNLQEVETIWMDGAAKLEEVISRFPENCVYMRWNYSSGQQSGNIKALEWYQQNGLNAMVATAAQSGPAALFPFDDRAKEVKSRGMPAIKGFINLAKEKDINGMLCTAWDDRSPHMETFWRGFIASAQYSWSQSNMSLKDFDTAYLQREFGVKENNYGKIYVWLREAADFWEGAFNPTNDRLNIHNAMLPLPGISHSLTPEESKKIRESKNIDFSKRLIELPDLQKTGEWSKKYKDRLDRARAIMNGYLIVNRKLDSLYHSSHRNRYHWELFMALNSFQVKAPQLLLALESCDTSNKEQFAAGKIKVREALVGFRQAWEELEQVYAQSRFISYPEGYVPDRYYHFASQREDLSYLIQVEENFHKMVRGWMELDNE